jgi:hypothetical protein
MHHLALEFSLLIPASILRHVYARSSESVTEVYLSVLDMDLWPSARLDQHLYGPTALVNSLFGCIIAQTTSPAPSGAHEGMPTPVPPILVQPDQDELL